MAIPTASFTYTTNGLTATFHDTSTGGTSRLWQFGANATPNTSSDKDPQVTFSTGGIYTVSLTVTNTDGSATFEMMLVFNTAPGLNLTILEMVLAQLPSGIPVNPNTFNNLIKKWQLYLQPGLRVSDADVFDETKWIPLANVLIAKLIIYELILMAAQSAMSSVSQSGAATAVGTTSNVLLTDYAMIVDFSSPLTIESIFVDGTNVTVGSVANNMTELLSILNGIGKGNWVVDPNNPNQAISLNDQYLWASFIYHTAADNTSVPAVFNQSNQHLSTVTTTSTGAGGTTVGGRGPIKSIQTGPSKAEWYDNSAFWKSMFSSTASSGTGGFGGGVIDAIKEEICMYSRRIEINLPFCPAPKLPRIFIVGNKTRCS